MAYTLDEIISSAGEKPWRTGLDDFVTDTVDAPRHLQKHFGPTEIRVHATTVPVSRLRILQPDIEMWRYLRLCCLSAEEFGNLMEKLPLICVRGRSIQDYPLLQGNHRALYALMHGIEELPAVVHVIVEEEGAFRFQAVCERQYAVLDKHLGRHDVIALREAYKNLLAELVYLRARDQVEFAGPPPLDHSSAAYEKLLEKNEQISAEIPCVSLRGYLKTLDNIFCVPADKVPITQESVFYRFLVLTQDSVEERKLKRIAAKKRLLNAPVILVRTRMLDYVAAGHTRLRARLDADIERVDALVIHAESDDLNRFLDQQSRQAGYLVGPGGLRRLRLI